jgi:hypothetical protein
VGAVDPSQHDLFLSLLAGLRDCGALPDLVLVGSWCLPVYAEVYGDWPEMPMLRTTDLDILVPHPSRVSPGSDVSGLLTRLGLDPVFDRISGRALKYEGPLLDVEFLAPRVRQRGDSPSDQVAVPSWGVSAQVLSYMEIARDNAMPISYGGIRFRVPSLPAYVLHKSIIQPLRVAGSLKAQKDADTVRGLGEVIVRHLPSVLEDLKVLFSRFPTKWRAKVLSMLAVHSPELHGILADPSIPRSTWSYSPGGPGSGS